MGEALKTKELILKQELVASTGLCGSYRKLVEPLKNFRIAHILGLSSLTEC
jgi:hypothetical protein